jgi:hypothetical protein
MTINTFTSDTEFLGMLMLAYNDYWGTPPYLHSLYGHAKGQGILKLYRGQEIEELAGAYILVPCGQVLTDDQRCHLTLRAISGGYVKACDVRRFIKVDNMRLVKEI